MVLPEGISFIKPDYHVRTAHVNHFNNINSSLFKHYEKEKSAISEENALSPVWGERWVSNPRPPEPQSGALTN